MFTEQPTYSTKTLHKPPPKSSLFQIAVENDWDHLAEAVVASFAEASSELDQLVLLLESHGVIVHRSSCSSANSQSIISTAAGHAHYSTSDPSIGSDSRNIQSVWAGENPATYAPWPAPEAVPAPSPLVYLPRNAALVHGSRVIETPPSRRAGEQSRMTTCTNALFSLLERAKAETVRWPVVPESNEKTKASEGLLIDAADPAGDEDSEGPQISPSDVIIVSPTLLITRLSSHTNSKGLEYLWSVLSQPSGAEQRMHTNGDGLRQAAQPTPPVSPATPARPTTTTLLVRITEPDSTGTVTAPPSPSPLRSPRFPPTSPPRLTPVRKTAALPGPLTAPSSSRIYTPLCRVLVPIDQHVMLYDPAFVAEGEARRLKTVLDRVQEGGSGSSGDYGVYATETTRSKRDSVMSYGTFGSSDAGDGEGWQFVSVEGLHATSILLVSPQLALLSPAPLAPSSNPASPTGSSISASSETLTRVSQILESFGMRVVVVSLAQLNALGVGIRDAVLVLRRESYVASSEDRSDAAAAEHEDWERVHRGVPEEGCLGPICAALGGWLCGWLTSNESDIDHTESLHENEYP